MDYRLTQTGQEVQAILDRSPIEVDGAQLDTFITEASEGWYIVPLDSGGSMLVQVVMDGPVIYQVGLTEPHSGRIMLRHYNTQAATPAWTEWTDAYVDKLTAQDIAFGHVGDSGMKITIGGVDHIVSQTSQPLGSSNSFVAPTWEALTIALATKQDTIEDLSTIRSGAAAGATAYQKPGTGIPESDMASDVQTTLNSVAGKANRSEVPSASDSTPLMDGMAAAGTATAYARGDHRHPSDTAKQDVISDLSTIRSGAAAGATAYQKPSGGIPKTDLASAVQSSLDKADAAQPAISTVNVTVDNNTGTPSGSASVSGNTMSFSFQNLKGATGAQGPQGIQGVQGPQGPQGPTGVSGDASSLAIIHGIDKTTSSQRDRGWFLLLNGIISLWSNNKNIKIWDK